MNHLDLLYKALPSFSYDRRKSKDLCYIITIFLDRNSKNANNSTRSGGENKTPTIEFICFLFDFKAKHSWLSHCVGLNLFRNKAWGASRLKEFSELEKKSSWFYNKKCQFRTYPTLPFVAFFVLLSHDKRESLLRFTGQEKVWSCAEDFVCVCASSVLSDVFCVLSGEFWKINS